MRKSTFPSRDSHWMNSPGATSSFGAARKINWCGDFSRYFLHQRCVKDLTNWNQVKLVSTWWLECGELLSCFTLQYNYILIMLCTYQVIYTLNTLSKQLFIKGALKLYYTKQCHWHQSQLSLFKSLKGQANYIDHRGFFATRCYYELLHFKFNLYILKLIWYMFLRNLTYKLFLQFFQIRDQSGIDVMW